LTELLVHRQSSILTYVRCGEQYRRRYVEGDVRPPGVRMLRGTGVHAGAKHNFRQKIESHEDLKGDDIIDFSIATFDDRLKNEGVSLAPDEKSRGEGIVVGEERDRVHRLSTLYADDFAPVIQPVSVEQTIEAEFPSKGFKLHGTLDLKDTREIVIDLKSSVRKRSKGDQHKDFQLTMYSALVFTLEKKMPAGAELVVLVDKKSGAEVQILPTTRTVQDFAAWFRYIEAVHNGITKGVFPPANKADWWCSPKWCGYWFDCQFWSDSERSRVTA